MNFQIILALFLVAGTLVYSGLSLYVKYVKLEEMESYFTENKAVCDTKRFWRRNQHIDRLHRWLVITEILEMPKMHIKKGEVTEAELAAVPLSLKRWAVWPTYFGYILMLGAGLWAYLYGW